MAVKQEGSECRDELQRERDVEMSFRERERRKERGMEMSFRERGEKREGWRWRWRQTGRRRDRKRELTEIDKGAQRVEVLRERKKE